MLEKIRDIQKALKAEAYLSAFALALTLPDICGKVVYPNMKSGERYAKWFDENVLKDRYPKGYPDERKFDGKKVYKLRCAFLHEGNVQGVPDVVLFKLRIIESGSPGLYGASSYQVTKCNDSTCCFQVVLDINVFCLDVGIAAESFYNSHKNKLAFDEQNIVITKIPLENSGLLH